MVLESIKPSWMERKPTKVFWIGFIYSVIGIVLAWLVFGDYASISGVFLTTMPLVVIMYRLLKFEEKKDLRIRSEKSLIKEHGKALSLFIFMFLGMVIAYSLLFTILPQDVTEKIFSLQINVIKSINIEASGYFINHTAALGAIVLNNLKVLFFSIFFSFLYGSGAIFILALNASLIGVAVGSIIRNSISEYAGSSHIVFLYNYFQSFPLTFGYAVHGIPEISAYFVGALAGGIISVAVVNHDFGNEEFRRIVRDSVDLLLISVLLLVLAGLLEVYVSPYLF